MSIHNNIYTELNAPLLTLVNGPSSSIILFASSGPRRLDA